MVGLPRIGIRRYCARDGFALVRALVATVNHHRSILCDVSCPRRGCREHHEQSHGKFCAPRQRGGAQRIVIHTFFYVNVYP